MHEFDPCEFIIKLEERLHRLEVVHNRLARAFETSEKELNAALGAIQFLQEQHLRLVKRINESEKK